jgi:hypothetical protein
LRINNNTGYFKATLISLIIFLFKGQFMILLLLLSHVRCLLLHSIGTILLQFMMRTLRHGTKIILSVLLTYS